METHFSLDQIEAGLIASPRDGGRLDMIVCRPNIDERRVLERAELDGVYGLVGDSWLSRGSAMTAGGSAHPDMQITIMNSRVIQAITQDRSLWPLAGDQLFVDLDLSDDNLPPGQRIAVGTALLEITAVPHTGCAKFAARFGHDAVKFVNSPEGRRLRRRGLNARVIRPGTICVGDVVTRIGSE